MSETLSVKVKCDSCGWSRGEQDAHEWFGVGCPDCGTEIVSEKDLEILSVLELMQGAGLVNQNNCGVDNLHVDTSALREQGKPLATYTPHLDDDQS